MRSVHPFNNGWLYSPTEQPYDSHDHQYQPITLPHANITLPHRNFDNLEYQFISTYRKRFTLPEQLNGRRLFVDFGAAMTSCTLIINGHTLGDHDGGYIPFSFDLTDYLRTGENLLHVRLDSTERPDVPPNGLVVDYLTFGGIYRDVELRYVEPLYIERIFARPLHVLTAPALEVDIFLSDRAARFPLRATLRDAAGIVIAISETVEAGGVEDAPTIRFSTLPPVRLWTPTDPALYTVTVELLQHGTVTDAISSRIGFREAIFTHEGFFLNGELLKLVGLNRHQTYPYIGAAAPARLQRKDADILKDELGVNIARTSHYPQSPHFLDRCDEIGLLVFEEIPGWQFIGDSDWQALSLRDVRAMIERDRNHPSIILWGVRINESFDNTAFYTATNALAHKIDPTRQTGGVRYFLNSEFLEDVYTYNDFSNTIVEPTNTPHLVTEFSGHMYSTKTSDQEERQIEHALRHARIQDKQLGMPNVTGAIGWCAFDYNTHKQFGSGDRVCYHGVMDIFRLPKFAAAIYESQIPVGVRPVLRPLTTWAPGDRSGGGFDPLLVCSNCEEVELFLGDQSLGRKTPDRLTFPHLPHPPFSFSGGLKLEEGLLLFFTNLRMVGYVNGEAVIEHTLRGDGLPQFLEVRVDDAELHADGADMTRLVFRVTDNFGNRLVHANHVISFTLEGEGELIGENPFPIIGGQAALYIKATHTPGTITVRASAPRLGESVVTVRTV